MRERIEQIHVLYVNELKDFMDKARKIHQRLYQIQEFEMPSGVSEQSGPEIIQQVEIVELINALKM